MSRITMNSTKAMMYAEILRLNAELALACEISIKDTQALERVKYELASLKVSRAPDPLTEAKDAHVEITRAPIADKPRRIVNLQPQWQIDRAASMAAARAQAMQFGVSVKV